VLVGGASTGEFDRFTGGGGTDYVAGGAGTTVLVGGAFTGEFDQFTGSNGTDYVNGGAGVSVLNEGSGTDVFHGGTGTAYINGGTGSSAIYGGSGSDFVYTGAANQFVSAGTGTTVFEDVAAHLTNGRYDQIDNFQTATPASTGTFVYLPQGEANSTNFYDTNGGTLIDTLATDGSQGHAAVFVSGVSAATVKEQTFFNL